MQKAYALLTVKSVDADRRVITGIATTPEPDRVGDIIEPFGVTYKNPLPLLLHHDSKLPVGKATFQPPTAQGVAFEASIPHVTADGVVKLRVDEAWDSVKAGLITGVSIGFRPIGDTVEQLKSGGFRFKKIEVGELSLVTIPANMSATILTVKSLDLAASGLTPSGVTDPLPVVRVKKDAPPMTTAEQIASFEAKRAANVAAMNALMSKSDGSTLDEAQTEEYTTLEREVDSIDGHLPRLRKLATMQVASATPIAPVTDAKAASELRGGNVPRVTITPMLPKGTAFTRAVMAMAAGKGDSYRTLEIAKQWDSTTPEVKTLIDVMPRMEMLTKAAIAAGTTTDSTWAGPLAVVTPLMNEFLELLRPATLIGRIPGMKYVPFNISIASQTTGGTYGWVGQNKPKPVTKADYSTVTLTFAKAAGIIVLTEELVKLSTPSAENLVRQEMVAGMVQFLDSQFTDPAVAAVANVNPASITNGASTAAASGVTGAAAKADLAARVATFTAAGLPLEGSVWLMSDSNAFGLGLAMNALGQPLFPGVGINGGSIFGIPIVVSNALGTRVVLMHAPSILIADDGAVSIDVSREASVQMDSSPTDTVDATTVYVSLWQRNLVGLKAERFITWLRARTAAVTYITAAAYNGT
jgi:HK97 family phage major capsid protein/HK97 family phage prohead protease